ncbi:MAG: IS982 family transposase, partial [Wolbachia sp.]
MYKNITELFCFIGDYCKIIDENFANGKIKRS